MPRASVEHMNARRAGKAASGGATQSRRVEYAPDVWSAADIERRPVSGRLHSIGREIAARIERLDKYGGKAVDMVDSINQLLSEAEKFCDAEGFEAFKKPLLSGAW
jgi:hypothetical protein